MQGKLTISDVRSAGFCVRGVRRHYESLNLDDALPFREALREGIPFEFLDNIDDAQVQKALKIARDRQEKGDES